MMLNSGDVSLHPGATFRPIITGVDPDYDTQPLSVTGTVSLGGSALALERIFGPLPLPGKIYVIIRNDGTDPVNGTFAGLPAGTSFRMIGMRWQISYTGGDGNDVALTFLELLPPEITSISIRPGTGAHAGYDFLVVQADGIPQIGHRLLYTTDLVTWLSMPGPGFSNGTYFEFRLPLGTKRAFVIVERLDP
jgi:hypothetical protein